MTKTCYEKTNGGPKYNSYIKTLKEWTKKNFYFHNGVVSYATHDGELEKLSSLPEGMVDEDKMIYETKVFDTAFSHLMFTLILVGERKECEEASERLKQFCVELGANEEEM